MVKTGVMICGHGSRDGEAIRDVYEETGKKPRRARMIEAAPIPGLILVKAIHKDTSYSLAGYLFQRSNLLTDDRSGGYDSSVSDLFAWQDHPSIADYCIPFEGNFIQRRCVTLQSIHFLS